MSSDSHSYAISIEWKIRKAFHCDRCGFGGIADADFIDSVGGMYTAMACSLATIYNDLDSDNKKRVDMFLDSNSYFSDKSIEQIIEESGIKEVERIIKEYEELI